LFRAPHKMTAQLSCKNVWVVGTLYVYRHADIIRVIMETEVALTDTIEAKQLK
jgi:hypothetical protein